MVSGKPYISVKSATRKAAKAPNERQSRALRGCVKLNAKMMNTAALRMTSDQRPEAGVSVCIMHLLAVAEAGAPHGHGRRVHDRASHAGANATRGTGGTRHTGVHREHAPSVP